MIIEGMICICISLLLLFIGVLVAAVRRRKLDAGKPAPREYDHVADAFASSVIGSRKSQQDSFSIPDRMGGYTLRAAGCLAVMCDGMGGMQGGERASALCADMLYKSYYCGRLVKDVSACFVNALAMADDEISRIRNDDGTPMKSGTTCVAAVVKNGTLYWASAGDSRIYIYSRGQLRQVTRDHNYSLTLREQVAAGRISAQQAMNDPQRDALISYVGKGSINILDTGEEKLDTAGGDIVLLCSDGLYRALSEQEIAAVIEENIKNGLYTVPPALTAASTSKTWMKHDNTTVVTVA